MQTKYWLTVDGLNWREIARTTAVSLLPLVVRSEPCLPTERRYILSADLGTVGAVRAPELQIIRG